MIHIQKENAYTISYHEFFIKKNNNVFAIFGDFLHDFYISFHDYMTGVLPTPPSLLTVPWSRTLTTTAVNSHCVTTRLRLLLFLPQSPPVLYQDSLLQLQTSSPPQLPTLMVNIHFVSTSVIEILVKSDKHCMVFKNMHITFCKPMCKLFHER